MTHRATEVHESAFGEKENFVAVGECIFIYLRLDARFLHAGRSVERIDLNLVVEVADVTKRSPDLSSAACARV